MAARKKTKRLVGKNALTMVRPEGSDAPSIYVYAGEPVPAGADPDDVKRLIDEGYLEEQEVAATSSDDGEDGATATDAPQEDLPAPAAQAKAPAAAKS
jgi:hypothetical protein